MKSLTYTLAAEGPSDDMLLPVIEWVLDHILGPSVARNGRMMYSSGTRSRIERAVTEFPDVDLLIVHADADPSTGHSGRLIEINSTITALCEKGLVIPSHVCVIPVRESEAWLLFDEAAIRRAAMNPNGRARWRTPSPKLDQIADPKQVLEAALDAASEQSGRKLAKFQRNRTPSDVAREIADFTPLRKLEAFRIFEAEVAKFAEKWLTDDDE
jgi:hypothetical protein